jgi:hypothetical protein
MNNRNELRPTPDDSEQYIENSQNESLNEDEDYQQEQ